MTENAFEHAEVALDSVAVGTGIPFFTVPATVDRKQGIVIPGGGLPGSGGVTGSAVGGEIRTEVIGIVGVVIIGLMTAVAVGGCTRVSRNAVRVRPLFFRIPRFDFAQS